MSWGWRADSDSVVLCRCGIGTAVPESWKAEVTTCPTPSPYSARHPGCLCGALQRHPSPCVPTSLTHWNLFLPCPCIPNPLVSKQQNSKNETTAPYSTDFNTISPWNGFLNTKERVYVVKYCFRAHFSYSFPCKCFCTLSAKDPVGTQCEALPNDQSVRFQILFTNEFSITMFGTTYCSVLHNLLCGPAVLTYNGWLRCTTNNARLDIKKYEKMITIRY